MKPPTTRSPRPIATALAAVALLELTACGSRALPAASPSPAAASAQPSDGDIAPHYRENHRYRERTVLSSAARGRVEAVLVTVRGRLESLPRPVSPETVSNALMAAGTEYPWTVRDQGGAVAFATEVDEQGCLIGTVTADAKVVIEPAGFVLDGGCHAESGH